jgi:PAS domain-containing protein
MATPVRARFDRIADFAQLLEASADAMLITRSDGRIVGVNTQTEKLFEYSREELMGQTPEMLMPRHLAILRWSRFRKRYVKPAYRYAHRVSPQASFIGSFQTSGPLSGWLDVSRRNQHGFNRLRPRDAAFERDSGHHRANTDRRVGRLPSYHRRSVRRCHRWGNFGRHYLELE